MEGNYLNNNFLKNITDEEIKNLPRNHFTGKIYVIESLQQINFLKSKLNNTKIIGFDTETKPSFKKGKINKVALIQLATENEAFLIRLNKIGFPDFLKDFFENETIVKVGLAIKDDLKSLKKIKHFESAAFIELQEYVKKFEILDNGLKKLTANILKFRISKRQQTSNWENDSLDENQRIYAATDAWVCYKIYTTLLMHSGNE